MFIISITIGIISIISITTTTTTITTIVIITTTNVMFTVRLARHRGGTEAQRGGRGRPRRPRAGGQGRAL